MTIRLSLINEISKLNESDYTKESYTNLIKVLNQVKTELSGDLTEEEVSKLEAKLETAIQSLNIIIKVGDNDLNYADNKLDNQSPQTSDLSPVFLMLSMFMLSALAIKLFTSRGLKNH